MIIEEVDEDNEDVKVNGDAKVDPNHLHENNDQDENDTGVEDDEIEDDQILDGSNLHSDGKVHPDNWMISVAP